MKRNHVARQFSLALVSALFVVGCATYDPTAGRGSQVRLDASRPNVSKVVKGELTLSVEEYATPEKSAAAFDTKMAEEGVLPLLIRVENGGQHDYEVKATEIIVRGKAVLKNLTSEQAAGKAERSAVGRALGWSMIVPIIGIPIAVVASAVHTNKVNKQINQDFIAKGFSDGVITPNKERSGFVFFELDAGRKDFTDLSLEMTVRNAATGEPVIIAAPLPAATFTPRSEPTENASREHRW